MHIFKVSIELIIFMQTLQFIVVYLLLPAYLMDRVIEN